MKSSRLVLTLVLLAAPLTARAQTAERAHRIGLLDYGTYDAIRRERWTAFRQQMRELGYVEGHNVGFESRFAEGDSDRLPRLAADPRPDQAQATA